MNFVFLEGAMVPIFLRQRATAALASKLRETRLGLGSASVRGQVDAAALVLPAAESLVGEQREQE